MASLAPPRTISRRRRVLVENLTAYAFLLPAALLIFIFGLFPVAFALFVSLHRWRRFPDEYIGLANYERALGGLAYVAFFWIALGFIVGGLWLLWRLMSPPPTTPSDNPEEKNSRQGRWSWREGIYLLPGVVNTAAILLFSQWFVLLLPEVLNIPRRIRGQETTQGLFVSELSKSFQVPAIAEAGNQAIVLILIAILLSIVVTRLVKGSGTTALLRATGAALFVASGTLMLQIILATINTAIETARAGGTELPVWSQIILISAGAGLVYAAYRLWGRAVRAEGDRRFIGLGITALLLALGGYLLIGELPRLLGTADRELLNGFSVTVMYAAFAIPFQLMIGLGLAYLLFQKLKGTTLFRIILFMPYIMPFLATALVFSLIFNHRTDSIINNLVGWVGIPPQKWLLEPLGVGRLIFGEATPTLLQGPSLALVVVILYTIWTYAGYAMVVFLAGLGNISNELYEAARIDGASGWAIFRRITLPLLSPTTFFLSLVAVIGTFQAFTQLWLMRNPAARDTLDTVSIVIFRQITDASPNYGYGSAMAFVLFGVILLLTFVQNRLAERRVFYG